MQRFFTFFLILNTIFSLAQNTDNDYQSMQIASPSVVLADEAFTLEIVGVNTSWFFNNPWHRPSDSRFFCAAVDIGDYSVSSALSITPEAA